MPLATYSAKVPEQCQKFSGLYHAYFSTVGRNGGFFDAASFDANTCELTDVAKRKWAQPGNTPAAKARAEAEKINLSIRNANFFDKQAREKALDNIVLGDGDAAPEGEASLRDSPESGMDAPSAGADSAKGVNPIVWILAGAVALLYLRGKG